MKSNTVLALSRPGLIALSLLWGVSAGWCSPHASQSRQHSRANASRNSRGDTLSPAPHGLQVCQLFVGELAPASPEPVRGNSSMPTLESYWKALGQIQGSFYNPDLSSAPDNTRLTYAGIRGILSSLNDPYTRFLSPPQYADLLNENRGTFPGIGVELRADNGKVYVQQIVPNSPASAAPLRIDDQVLKIGEVNVPGMTAEAAGALLKGREGAAVTLVVQRGDKTLTYTLVRREVSYPHFESRVLDGGIGYMHLLMFDEQAADNITKALQQFQKQGVKGLIFDLRDNPGGLLNAAVDVAGKFIPAGTVVWVQERGGQRSSLSTDGGAAKRTSLPTVVLVNHYSASASEIVSGAIKDTHSGTLIGLTTWGKGLVQEIIPLNDDSAIALTTAHYFTPNGSDINLKGVEPEITVGHVVQEPDDSSPAAQAAYTAEKQKVDDDQMQRAIDVLKQKMQGVTVVNVASRPQS